MKAAKLKIIIESEINEQRGIFLHWQVKNIRGEY